MTELRLHLRRLADDDLPFLHAMLREAAYWDEAPPTTSVEDVLADADLARYVRDWGRPGDAGVVADADGGAPLGAAWYRLFDSADRGYGFVAPDIPELGIATVPQARGAGVGRTLLTALLQVARSEGRPALSLSVDHGNVRADRLYAAAGFRRVEQDGESWTMLLELGPVRD